MKLPDRYSPEAITRDRFSYSQNSCFRKIIIFAEQFFPQNDHLHRTFSSQKNLFFTEHLFLQNNYFSQKNCFRIK